MAELITKSLTPLYRIECPDALRVREAMQGLLERSL